MSGAGALVARGRDAELYEYGRDRLLRRYLRHGGVPREVALMTLARAAGYPVPWAEALSETEMLLERIHGPTMAEDLALRPWRLWRHASTLASLHRRLHAIPAPHDLEAPLGEGRSLLHLDLHPQNVMLGAGGPLVIDWANARRGPGEADVAMTWLVVATSDLRAVAHRRRVAALRSLFLWWFLRHAGRAAARRALRVVGAARLADPNVLEAERGRVRRLAGLD